MRFIFNNFKSRELPKILIFFFGIIAFSFFITKPAHATIARVQYKHVYPGNSLVLTGTTAHDFLVLAYSYNVGGAVSTTVSDTQGNAWIQLSQTTGWPGGYGAGLETWYAADIAGGDDTITVTSHADPGFTVVEYSGVALTNPIDVFATSTATTTGTTFSVGPITTAGTNDGIFAAWMAESGNVVSSWDSPYSLIQSNGSHFDSQAELLNVAPTSTTATVNLSNSLYTMMALVAFKDEGGAGGTGPPTTGSSSYWIATSSNDWFNSSNWSLGYVPNSTTSVIFSASSSVDCDISTTSAVSVSDFTINSGFGGSINNSSAVSAASYSQGAGTYNGSGSGTLTAGGSFMLSGGTFNSGSSTYALSMDFSASSSPSLAFSGGTFNNGAGGVFINDATSGISLAISGNSTTTINNLYFGGIGSSTISLATGTIISVPNDLSFLNAAGETFSGSGDIYVGGDISAGSTSIGTSTSNVDIILNGTSTQFVGLNNALNLPNLEVAKPLGIAYMENSPTIMGSLSVTQGELQLATSTTAQTVEIDGPVTVDTGAVLSDYAAVSSTIKLGSSVTNNGTIFFAGDGVGCLLPSDLVLIRSTNAGTTRAWSGSGNFVMRYIDVKDQDASAVSGGISDYNGTLSNSSGWTAPTGARPQLVQNIATSTTLGVGGSVTLSFPFAPRAGDLIVVGISTRNGTIGDITDSAGNTYAAVASSTFGSSPAYYLGMYYAQNIVSTSSFSITMNGTYGAYFSASVMEYTGMANFSVLNAHNQNTDTSGSATDLTSGSAVGTSENELNIGVMTLDMDTTATGASGWTSEDGFTDNTSGQALYVEDFGMAGTTTTAATWTAATTTDYAAIVGIFKSPNLVYAAEGTLDSSIFDTGVAASGTTGGAMLNSVGWDGTLPNAAEVKFQFATSNSSSGPWNFVGCDGLSSDYFPCGGGGAVNYASYSLLQGGYPPTGRYFRYRVILTSTPDQSLSPTVENVIVNWSP